MALPVRVSHVPRALRVRYKNSRVSTSQCLLLSSQPQVKKYAWSIVEGSCILTCTKFAHTIFQMCWAGCCALLYLAVGTIVEMFPSPVGGATADENVG